MCTGAAFAIFGGYTKAVAPFVPPNAIATTFVFGTAAAGGTVIGAAVDVPPAAGVFVIVGAYTDAVSFTIDVVAVADGPTWIETF